MSRLSSLRVGRARDVSLLALGLALSTALSFLGDVAWFCDLFSGFVVYYALLAALFALAALAVRSRFALWVSVATLLVNLALLAPFYLAPRRTAPPHATPLRLLHFNVRLDNWDHAGEIASYLDRSGADLVMLVETDGVWVDLLRAHMPHYRLVQSSTDGWRNPYFGTALFARRGIEPRVTVADSQVEFFEVTRGHPAISAQLTLGGRRLALVAVHQHPPISRVHFDIRAAQYRGVAAWLLQHPDSILIGDLNATPWSLPYRRMVRATHLVNGQRGFGLHASFFPFGDDWLGLPIDHCLHSDSLVTTAFSFGPRFGSDHRPLRVDLAFR